MEKLSFDQVKALIDHIGEEERHFNQLELEYRKLASQWLLVALGAIGFVLSRENQLILPPWTLVMGIALASSIGIFVLWLLDLKVYHELLHAAFREGVKLERDYPEFLPQIRSNMVRSHTGGDIIKRVVYYYFFSMLLLILIANISVWMGLLTDAVAITVNIVSAVFMLLLFKIMTRNSVRDLGV